MKKFIASLLSILQLFWSIPEDLFAQDFQEPSNAVPIAENPSSDSFIPLKQAREIQEHEQYLQDKQFQMQALRSSHSLIRSPFSKNPNPFMNVNDPVQSFKSLDFQTQNIHRQLRSLAEMELRRIAAYMERYVLAYNKDKSIKKTTYFNAVPIRIENERLVDSHGKQTIRNTRNMKYNEKRQLISYESESLDALGNTTKTTWKEGTYYTKSDEQLNARTKEGYVKSYTEMVELPSGEVITRRRDNILYYNKKDEELNSRFVQEQIAGYTETYVSNQAPDAPRLTVWSNATYVKQPFTPTSENPDPAGGYAKKKALKNLKKEPDILLTSFHEETTVLGLTSVRDINTIEYNEYEEQTSYHERIERLGLLYNNEFRGGRYDEWGRLIQYNIRSEVGGEVTITERLETEYTSTGLILRYVEKITYPNGVVEEVEFIEPEYNEIGQLLGFIRITNTEEGEIRTTRSDIEYNSLGLETSYTDTIESEGLTTIIEMSDITYNENGLIYSFLQTKTEIGSSLEWGEVFDIDRVTVTERVYTRYNGVGQETEYFERVQDPLGFTEETLRSGILRNQAGRVTAYHDVIHREIAGVIDVPLRTESGEYVYGPDGQIQTRREQTEQVIELERNFEGRYNSGGELIFSRETERNEAMPDLTIIRTRQGMEYTRGHLTNFIEILEETGPGIYRRAQTTRSGTQIDRRGRPIRYQEFYQKGDIEILRIRDSIVYSNRNLILSYREIEQQGSVVTIRDVIQTQYDYFEREIFSRYQLQRGILREEHLVRKTYNALHQLRGLVEEIRSNATALSRVMRQGYFFYSIAGQILGYHKEEEEAGQYRSSTGREVVIDRETVSDRTEIQYNRLGQEIFRKTLHRDIYGFQENIEESNIQYNISGQEASRNVRIVRTGTGEVSVPETDSEGNFLVDVSGNLITRLETQTLRETFEKRIHSQIYNIRGELISSTEEIRSSATPDKTLIRTFQDAFYNDNGELTTYREIFRERGIYQVLGMSYPLDSVKEILWSGIEYDDFGRILTSMQTIVENLGIAISRVRRNELFNPIGLIDHYTETEQRGASSIRTRRRIDSQYDAWDREISNVETSSKLDEAQHFQNFTEYNFLNQIYETRQIIQSNLTPLIQNITRTGMMYGGVAGNFLLGYREIENTQGSYTGIDGVLVAIDRTKLIDRLNTSYNRLGQEIELSERRQLPNGVLENFTRFGILYNEKGQVIARDDVLRKRAQAVVTIPTQDGNGEETSVLETNTAILDQTELSQWRLGSYNTQGQLESYTETIQSNANALSQTRIWQNANYDEEERLVSYQETLRDYGQYIDALGVERRIDKTIVQNRNQMRYNTQNQLISYEEELMNEYGERSLREWRNATYGPTGLIQSYHEEINQNILSISSFDSRMTRRDWSQARYDALDQLIGYREEIIDPYGVLETRIRENTTYSGLGFIESYRDQMSRFGDTIDPYGVRVLLDTRKTINWNARGYNRYGELLRYHEEVRDPALAQVVVTDHYGMTRDLLGQIRSYQESIRANGSALDASSGITLSLNLLQRRTVQVPLYNLLGQALEGQESEIQMGDGFRTQREVQKNRMVYQGSELVQYEEITTRDSSLLTQHRVRELTLIGSKGQVTGYREYTREYGTDSHGITLDRTSFIEQQNILYDPLGRLFSYEEMMMDPYSVEHRTARTEMYYDDQGRLISHREKRERSDIPGQVNIRRFYGAQYNPFAQLLSYIEEEEGFGTTVQRIRTDVRYDRQGNIIHYLETINDRGVRTQNIFSNARYNGLRQLMAYRLTSASLGQTQVFDFRNARYDGDQRLVYYEAILEPYRGSGHIINITWSNAVYDSLGRLLSSREERTSGSSLEVIDTSSIGYDSENRVSDFTRTIHKTDSGLDWTLTQVRSSILYDGRSDTVIAYRDDMNENGILWMQNYQVTAQDSLRRVTDYQRQTNRSGVTQTFTRQNMLYDDAGALLQGALIGYTDQELDSRFPGLVEQTEHQTLGINSMGLETDFREETALNGALLNSTETRERSGISYTADGMMESWQDVITIGSERRIEQISNSQWNDLGLLLNQDRQIRHTATGLDVTETVRLSLGYDRQGRLTNQTEVVRNSSAPDITTTTVVDNIIYGTNEQRSAYRERVITDGIGIDPWTVTGTYNSLVYTDGLLSAYTRQTMDSRSPDASRQSNFSSLRYSPDGLLLTFSREDIERSPTMNVTTTVDRLQTQYDARGREIGASERSSDSARSGLELTTTVARTYNLNGQISVLTQATEARGSDGYSLTTTATRNAIIYNTLGLMTSWLDTSTESAHPVLTQEQVNNARWNHLGQLTSYEAVNHSAGPGLDVTETTQTTLGYNRQSQVNRIEQRSTNSSSPDLTTSTTQSNINYGRDGNVTDYRQTQQFSGVGLTPWTLTTNYASLNYRNDQLLSYTATTTDSRFSGLQNVLMRSASTYNDNGFLNTFVEERMDLGAGLNVTTTTQRMQTTYNTHGEEVGSVENMRASNRPALQVTLTNTRTYAANGRVSSWSERRNENGGLDYSLTSTSVRSAITYDLTGNLTGWIDVETTNRDQIVLTERISDVRTNRLGQMTRASSESQRATGVLSETDNIERRFTYSPQNLMTSFSETTTYDPMRTARDGLERTIYTLSGMIRSASGLLTSYRESWDQQNSDPLRSTIETVNTSGITYAAGQVNSFDTQYANTLNPTLNSQYEFSNIQRNLIGQITSSDVTVTNLSGRSSYEETLDYDIRGRIESRLEVNPSTSTILEGWDQIRYNDQGQINSFDYIDSTGTTHNSGIAYTDLSLTPDDSMIPHPEILWRHGSTVIGNSELGIVTSAKETSLREGGADEAILSLQSHLINSELSTRHADLNISQSTIHNPLIISILDRPVLPNVIPLQRLSGTASTGALVFRGTTTQIERSGTTYNASGQVTGFVERTRIFGTITNPDGSVQEIQIETSVNRVATVYDIFGQEIGFEQIERDASGVETQVIRSNITRNELGIIIGFTETRKIILDPDRPKEEEGELVVTQIREIQSFDRFGRIIAFIDRIITDGYYNNPLNYGTSVTGEPSRLRTEETTYRTNTEYDAFGRITRTSETYVSSVESAKTITIDKAFGDFDSDGYATHTEQKMREQGRDEFGNEIDVTREIIRSDILRNALGLEISYHEEISALMAGMTNFLQQQIREYRASRYSIHEGRVLEYKEKIQDLIKNSTQKIHKHDIEYTARGKEKSFITDITETLQPATGDRRLVTTLKRIAGSNYQYNLLGQLISSTQIISEQLQGRPIKETKVQFGQATYNRLGQLQSYKEASTQHIETSDSVNTQKPGATIKDISQIQYSKLGLQVASIEKVYESNVFQFERQVLDQHYDVAGRLVEDRTVNIQSTGEKIESSRSNLKYDKHGNLTSYQESGTSNATGSYSFSRNQTFNVFGQLSSFKEEGTRFSSPPYEASEANIVYDDLGRKESYQRLEKDLFGTRQIERTSTEYDSLGHVQSYAQNTQETLTNGKQSQIQETRSEMIHDDFNRLISSKNYTKGTSQGRALEQTVSMNVSSFDEVGRTIEYKEITQNHVESRTMQSIVQTSYNEMGQLTSQTERLYEDGFLQHDRTTTHQVYDSYGRVVSDRTVLSLASGEITHSERTKLTYDEVNNLISFSEKGYSNANGNYEFSRNLIYDSIGQISQTNEEGKRSSNGSYSLLESKIAYDQLGRKISFLSEEKDVYGNHLTERQWTSFDSKGRTNAYRQTTEGNLKNGKSAKAEETREAMTYDNANRLTYWKEHTKDLTDTGSFDRTTETYVQSFDHAGRSSRFVQKIDNHREGLKSENIIDQSYNDLGQIKNKKEAVFLEGLFQQEKTSSNQIYDESGRIISDESITRLASGEVTHAKRENVIYDDVSNMVSFSESGSSNASGDYSFSREQEFEKGEVVAYREKGTRSSDGAYTAQESNIQYDELGRVSSFHRIETNSMGTYITQRTSTHYDRLGRMDGYVQDIESKFLNGQWTKVTETKTDMVYDEMNRLTSYQIQTQGANEIRNIDETKTVTISQFDHAGRASALNQISQDRITGHKTEVNITQKYNAQGQISQSQEKVYLDDVYQYERNVRQQTYDAQGRVNLEVGTLEYPSGERISYRKENMQYDNYGNLVSYSEKGNSNAHGQYSFTRTQNFNALGQVISSHEEGTRASGGDYTTDQSNVVYDDWGRVIAYHQVEKDATGTHVTDRLSTDYDSQNRVIGYHEKSEDQLGNGVTTHTETVESGIAYDHLNRITSRNTHTWGSNSKGDTFDSTVVISVLEFDKVGRSIKTHETVTDHKEGKTQSHDISYQYNRKGQLSEKRFTDEKGDEIIHRYQYDRTGVLETQKMEHPDYILVLDRFGDQIGYEIGWRALERILDSQEVEEALLDHGLEANKVEWEDKNDQMQQGFRGRGMGKGTKSPEGFVQYPPSLESVEAEIRNLEARLADLESTKSPWQEAERNLIKAELTYARAQRAYLGARTPQEKQRALRAMEFAHKEVVRAENANQGGRSGFNSGRVQRYNPRQIDGPVRQEGETQTLEDGSKQKNYIAEGKGWMGNVFSITISGRQAWITNGQGEKVAELRVEGNKLIIDNLVTGHQTTMEYGQYGLESSTELSNIYGFEVRNENHTYTTDASGRVTEHHYTLHDENAMGVQTSEGYKATGGGVLNAWGTTKFNDQGQAVFHEESRTLSNGKWNVAYDFYLRIEGITYDRLGQQVSFHREQREGGLGIRGYNSNITREGTVDETGKLNYYKETEHTTMGKKVTIDRIHEARPEYDGDKIINEHREKTYEKIVVRKSWWEKLFSFILPILAVVAFFIPGINVIAAAGIAAAWNFITGMAMGQSPLQAFLGAVISFATSMVAAGIGGIMQGLTSAAKTVASSVSNAFMQQVSGTAVRTLVARVISTAMTTAFGDRLGRWGSLIASVGSMFGSSFFGSGNSFASALSTSNFDFGQIAKEAVLTTAKFAASSFLSSALGDSIWINFAASAMGAVTDSMIDVIGQNLTAYFSKPEGSELTRDGLIPDGAKKDKEDGWTEHYQIRNGEFVRDERGNPVPIALTPTKAEVISVQEKGLDGFIHEKITGATLIDEAGNQITWDAQGQITAIIPAENLANTSTQNISTPKEAIRKDAVDLPSNESLELAIDLRGIDLTSETNLKVEDKSAWDKAKDLAASGLSSIYHLLIPEAGAASIEVLGVGEPGHEILTQAAAQTTGLFTDDEIDIMMSHVRDNDLGFVEAIDPPRWKSFYAGASLAKLGETHYGNYQFLHAMKAEGESDLATRDKMLNWVHNTNIEVLDLIKEGDWNKALAKASSVMHLIQDSYASGHGVRDSESGQITEFYNYHVQQEDSSLAAMHKEGDKIWTLTTTTVPGEPWMFENQSLAEPLNYSPLVPDVTFSTPTLKTEYQKAVQTTANYLNLLKEGADLKKLDTFFEKTFEMKPATLDQNQWQNDLFEEIPLLPEFNSPLWEDVSPRYDFNLPSNTNLIQGGEARGNVEFIEHAGKKYTSEKQSVHTPFSEKPFVSHSTGQHSSIQSNEWPSISAIQAEPGVEGADENGRMPLTIEFHMPKDSLMQENSQISNAPQNTLSNYEKFKVGLDLAEFTLLHFLVGEKAPTVYKGLVDTRAKVQDFAWNQAGLKETTQFLAFTGSSILQDINTLYELADSGVTKLTGANIDEWSIAAMQASQGTPIPFDDILSYGGALISKGFQGAGTLSKYLNSFSRAEKLAEESYDLTKIERRTINVLNDNGTVREIAQQSYSSEALKALDEVGQGSQIKRAGSFPNSNTTDAQFWSQDHPLTNPNFADDIGAASFDSSSVDFVIGGKAKTEANFITREAPSYGKHTGGKVEIVADPGDIKADYFHMPEKSTADLGIDIKIDSQTGKVSYTEVENLVTPRLNLTTNPQGNSNGLMVLMPMSLSLPFTENTQSLKNSTGSPLNISQRTTSLRGDGGVIGLENNSRNNEILPPNNGGDSWISQNGTDWKDSIRQSNFQYEKQITNMRYDKSGKLIGDSSITRLSTGEIIESTRSDIEYNALGQITSFSESGNSNASGSYSFTRTQEQDILGHITSIKEKGTRANGGAYTSEENNITYDDLGKKLTYQRTETDDMGKHITNRTSTNYDAQGRVSGYEQNTIDEFANGKRATGKETRSAIQYDAQNRITSWTSHTNGTGTDGKVFDITTQTQVQVFDFAGRASQYTENITDHRSTESLRAQRSNLIHQTYNSLGQLSSKEIREQGQDSIRQTYSYNNGVLNQTRVEHPDYIITLDKWGTQTSIEEGPRIKAAREQARRAEERARKAQKAASNLMARYKKQIEQELLNQALKAVAIDKFSVASKSINTVSLRGAAATKQSQTLLAQSQKSMAQAKSALAQAENQIRNAKTQSARAQAEAAKKSAETQIAIAQKKMEEAKKAMISASGIANRGKDLSLRGALATKQSLDRALASSRSMSSSKVSVGDPFSKIDISKFKIIFKGNTAQIKDANGNVLAEAKTQGKTVKISNNVTGSKVDMSYGKFGLASLKEVNSLGKEVRTESYNYKTDRTGKVQELNYLIKDTEPTSIQTSQGVKSVISRKAVYEASGTIKHDGKGRVTSSEENKTLKSDKKTIYSFHEALTGVQYDRLNQMVSFQKQTSEKGLGIKKYSTTITRTGEVDSSGKLSHYIENERTKQGKVKISRTFEATPTYQGDTLISENRIMTHEKIKQSSGIFQRIVGIVLPIALGLILAPVTAGISTALSASIGSVGSQMVAHGVTGFMSNMVTSIAMGAKPNEALKGALLTGGIAGIGAGANIFGSKIFGLSVQTAKQSLESSVTRQIITRSIMSAAGEKLGPVGSAVLGGALSGVMTGDPTQIALGTIKGAASGFIGQALGSSTGAQLANAAIGGFTDAAIDRIGQEIKTIAYNVKARDALPNSAQAYKGQDGRIKWAIQDEENGRNTIYQYNSQTNQFENQYTNVRNSEVLGTAYLAGANGIAFIPTLEAKGSVTHNNGITTYYDKQANFIESRPDNQYAIRDTQGRQIGTQLPLSMFTLATGQDVLFAPMLENGSSQALMVIPFGAQIKTENGQMTGSQIIDENGNIEIYRIDGTREARLGIDGSLISYDSRGEISYAIAPDGRAISYTFAGDPITLTANTQVDYELKGNLVLRELDNSYRIYEKDTDLLIESGNTQLIRTLQYDEQGRFYGAVEEDLKNQRENLYGADGQKIFTRNLQDKIIENIYGEAAGSLKKPSTYDEIPLRQWYDAQGNRAPVEEILSVYIKFYENGKNTVLSPITQGIDALQKAYDHSPLQAQILSITKGIQLGEDQGGWLTWLDKDNLLGKINLSDSQPELMKRMGPTEYRMRHIVANMFGDQESEISIAYPSPWVKWNNTKYVITLGQGVGNDAKSAYEEARHLANKVGQPVLYTVNPSHKDEITTIPEVLNAIPVLGLYTGMPMEKGILGVTEDVLVQASAQKFIDMPDATMAAKFKLHTEVLKNAPSTDIKIIHVGHSQDGLYTRAEANYLNKDEKRRIHYIALATASHTNPGFSSFDPYINPLDVVGHFLGQGAIKTIGNVAYFPIAWMAGNTKDYRILEYTPGHGVGHALKSYYSDIDEGFYKLQYSINKDVE